MIAWRLLSEMFAHCTVINVAHYVEELDAIDDANARAEKWEPGPLEDEMMRLPVHDLETDKTVELVWIRVPTVPVHTTVPARLVVALLQHDAWVSAGNWAGHPDFVPSRRSALLPSAVKLLKRKLHPDLPTLVDLVRLAILPSPAAERPEGDDTALYPVVKLLESLYRPPLPHVLTYPVADMRERVIKMRLRKRESQKYVKNPLSSKRLDDLIHRLSILLNEPLT